VKPLAELPPRPQQALSPGTLRSEDLDAFGAILTEVGPGPVLVTGTGECPRVVSAGLASAAAALGTRTALLECDLAAPSLAAALGLAPAPGLAEYLRHEAEAPQILQPLMLAGPASAKATGPLVCVVAGEPPASAASNPIDDDDFRHAVARLRDGYQLVVLQGPTLRDESGALPTIADEADSLVACVDESLASGISARRLRKGLRRLPARNAGVVVCN
jgi:MinD-like ATPase involved in chromosome partitioning or flagellar assembly